MNIEKCYRAEPINAVEVVPLVSYEEALKKEGIYRPSSGGTGRLVVVRSNQEVTSFWYAAHGLSIEPCMAVKRDTFTLTTEKLCVEIRPA